MMALLMLTSSISGDETLNCVAKVLDSYVTKNDQIFINLNDLSTRFNKSLLRYFGSIPIRNLNFKLNAETQKPYLLIGAVLYNFHPTIFVVSIEKKLQELKYLRADVIWNSKAKFIFITEISNFYELEKFIKENFMENFVIIKNWNIFGWKIQDLSLAYSNQSTLIQRIGNCSNVTRLFPERFFTNFTNLSVRACFIGVKPYAFFEPPNSSYTAGMEINLLKLFKNLMGFHLTFVESPHEVIHSTKIDPRHAWDILELNKTDIFFGKYEDLFLTKL